MTFWYLATPYSKYPGGRDAAYEAAVHNNGVLVRAGHVVYSPIVHCHPLVEAKFIAGSDFATWQKFDHAMILAGRGLIVCKLPGWLDSVGITAERAFAIAHDKPVIEMRPGEVPNELLL